MTKKEMRAKVEKQSEMYCWFLRNTPSTAGRMMQARTKAVALINVASRMELITEDEADMMLEDLQGAYEYAWRHNREVQA